MYVFNANFKSVNNFLMLQIFFIVQVSEHKNVYWYVENNNINRMTQNFTGTVFNVHFEIYQLGLTCLTINILWANH